MEKIGSLRDKAKYVDGLSFDGIYEVQTKKLKTGAVNVGNLVLLSGTADATGTVSNASHLVFTTSIVPAVGFTGNRIGGWASMEIYEGTAVDGTMIVFPAPGAGIASDRWRFSSGYTQLGGSEINHQYRVMAYNNSGATGTVYGVAKWKYIMNGGGTTSS